LLTKTLAHLGGVGWTAPLCCLRDGGAGAVHASNQRVNGRYDHHTPI